MFLCKFGIHKNIFKTRVNKVRYFECYKCGKRTYKVDQEVNRAFVDDEWIKWEIETPRNLDEKMKMSKPKQLKK